MGQLGDYVTWQSLNTLLCCSNRVNLSSVVGLLTSTSMSSLADYFVIRPNARLKVRQDCPSGLHIRIRSM